MKNLLLNFLKLNNKKGLKDLKKSLYYSFGNFIEGNELKIEIINKILKGLDKNKYKIWEQILLEELLLLKTVFGKEIPNDVFNLFENKKPFEGIDLSLKDLINLNMSFVLIPLDTTDMGRIPSEILHLWLVKGLDEKLNDHRHFLENNTIIDNEFKIFLSNSTIEKVSQINGKSWQLGSFLAQKAIEDIRAKQRLAKNWIITGAVNNENVDKIKLGNKLEIKLDNKTWLIPIENSQEVLDHYKENRKIWFTPGINSAWNIISGQSMVDGGKVDYPKAKEFHALVGSNPKAIISSILLIKPEYVCLWHSDSQTNSIKPAKLIEWVLKSISSDIIVEFKEIDSKNMIKATESLRDYFKETNFNKQISFNVTSGNRLMSYAVQNIARIFPNIHLIYKDVDEKDFNMTMIRYDQFPAITLTLSSKREVERKDINWGFLFGKEKYKNKEEFLFFLKES